MNMFTKVSGKGQIVVPKALRDRKGWPVGTDLEVIDAGEGVLLRPRSTKKGLTIEEATARLRGLYRHKGAPIPIERLSWSADFAEDDEDR